MKKKNSFRDIKIDQFRYIIDLNNSDQVCTCYDVADRRARNKYKTLIIPSIVQYEGKNYTVTKIDVDAFSCCKAETIYFPDTLIEISHGSFNGCDYLKSIYLPKSIQVIGSYSFTDCRNLENINFEGDLKNITIGNFVFYCSQYIKNLGQKINNEDNILLENGYIGNNLVAIENNIESLYIKPGTLFVYVRTTNTYINKIYFPTGIRSFHMVYENSIGQKLIDSVYFESIEDFLQLHISGNDFSFVNFYIKNELVEYINLPKSIDVLNLDNLSYIKNIKNINLNLNLKGIFGKLNYDNYGIKSSNYLKLETMYIPKSVTSLGYNVFRKMKINEFSIRTSQLCKFNNYYSEMFVDYLTLLVDSINFCIPESLVKTCNHINLITIKDFTSKELCDIFKSYSKSISYKTDLKLILDPDFLRISEEEGKFISEKCFPVININLLLLVTSAYYDSFKNHSVWGKIRKLDVIYDMICYTIEDRDSKTCSLSCTLDSRLGDRNLYSGVIKVQENTVIEGEIYKVIGVSDFAFSNCLYLDEVILQGDQTISDFANEGGNPDLIITKIGEI